MNNFLNLLSEETFSEKMTELATTLVQSSSSTAIKSWNDVQTIVRLGLADKIFNIGDQLVYEKALNASAEASNIDSDTPGITNVKVDLDKFVDTCNEVKNSYYEFNYDGANWHYDDNVVSLSTFGISYDTVGETPLKGDVVVVNITTEERTCEIIGIDHDKPADSNFKHSLTLQLVDCYKDLQVNAREALCYISEDISTNTNLYFKVANNIWCKTDNDNYFKINIGDYELKAGYQLVLTNSASNTIDGTKISVYSSSSNTELIHELTIELSSEDEYNNDANSKLYLGITDGTSENLNDIQRALYGYSNYELSAIRQYLNSDKPKGNVWKPVGIDKNKFERPPAWVSSEDGFLYRADKAFKRVLGEVQKETTQFNSNETIKSNERVFLLSKSEVFGDPDNKDGIPYSYYMKNTTLTEPGTSADEGRIKYLNNAIYNWVLRSASTGVIYGSSLVSNTGAISVQPVTGSNPHRFESDVQRKQGIVPICCIV